MLTQSSGSLDQLDDQRLADARAATIRPDVH